MSSLFDLLAQQTPHLQTRKGLILLGLQNDFLSPDGKLPIINRYDFLDPLKHLAPAFREFGDVIWVRSEFEATSATNALSEMGSVAITGPYGNSSDAADDEELLLDQAATLEQCCIRGSVGADYASQIKVLVDERKDMQVVKTSYSAFGSTSLLLTLRSKLITELYVCGCMTNLSVFATAMDAARYGIKITLIEDCLGYRTKSRHDHAIKQLCDIMEADVMSSKEVLEVLRTPPKEIAQGAAHVADEQDEVHFGEDAAHACKSELLAANGKHSKEEDEDTMLPMVCPSGSELVLRQSPSRNRSSQQVLATSTTRKHLLAAQSAEPPDAQLPRRRHSNDQGRGRGRDRADGVQSGVTGAVGKRGVKRDDLSKSQRSKDPWLEVLGSMRETASTNARKGRPYAEHPGLAALSAAARLDQRTVDDYAEAMGRARLEREPSQKLPSQKHAGMPLFGEGKERESAGSRIHNDLLPPERANTVFEDLKFEVQWQRMHHQTGEVPRLVCCQGEIGADGSKPVYRHPSDQTLRLRPWSPNVAHVRDAAEKVTGHPLNHVLIQLYRSGTDYISEHSDKTLDIVHGSTIVNASFGAQRTMRLRTKRAAAFPSSILSSPATAPQSQPTTGKFRARPQRTTHRIPMPHNSLLAMSLATNAEYLHGINADKRPSVELTDAEKAYGGQRISLTFRHIDTFLSEDEGLIWGQGAAGKTREEARPVVNGNVVESERLVRAFGTENQMGREFGWEEMYGRGFDVLHLREV